ncbi:MAG TPA: sigma-70 family RNA polymerase sigma factor [Pirellulales bacterium]|jgi:RNA polymerase sigma-70 factor (ECF subfamily)
MHRPASGNLSGTNGRDPIEAARAGSIEDFGALVSGLRDYLLFVANRELTPDLRAKISPSDVLQETFIQAQRKIADFAGSSEGELLAWLRGILLNKIQVAEQRYISAQARDVRREVFLDDSAATFPDKENLPGDFDTPSRRVVAAEQTAAVDTLLGCLPPEYERVLRLRYWEQLPLDEIAQQMHRSTDAVQKLWFRAVERLKREMHRREQP